MDKIILLALAHILAFALAATKAKAEFATSRTNALIERLKAAKFVCMPKAIGQICTARANTVVGFSYPQPITILIPAGVDIPRRVILNLHGFRGVCPATNATPEQIEADWQFTQQMISGGADDSVMLFPMSSGNCTTYGASLVPRFKAFTEWGAKLLASSTNRWIVSGHSGAGAHMANALSANPAFAKNVDSVFLLDATYGMGSTDSVYLDRWASVAKANPTIKIFTRYLAGTSTDSGSKNLKTRLPSNVDSAVSVAKSHCRVPAVEIKNLLPKNYKDANSVDLVSF